MIGAQLKELFRPWWVRLVLSGIAVVGAYDGVASQFELPNLKQLIGASGNLLPWWGWLLVLQAVLVATLFDYVRRNVPVLASAAPVAVPSKEIQKLAEKLELVRVDGEINKADLAKLKSQVEKQHSRVGHSLHAIGAREDMFELEAKLKEDAEVLYAKLSSGGSYDQAGWCRWENVNANWEANLKHWLMLARFYVDGIERKVLDVSEQEFSNSVWTIEDSQFPSADANRRFKRHRLILEHWEAMRGTANNNVTRVAFAGADEADVRTSNSPEADWRR